MENTRLCKQSDNFINSLVVNKHPLKISQITYKFNKIVLDCIIMLPDSKRKSGLSKAYIHAICYHAGYKVDYTGEDDFGVDLTIKEVKSRPSGKFSESGVILNVQLKATANYTETDKEITYELKNKNYNDLADKDVETPIILVILLLSKDESDWLDQNTEQLILKRCAYWCSLKGESQKNNEDSKTTIHIDKSRIFSVENLKNLFEVINSGRDLNEL